MSNSEKSRVTPAQQLKAMLKKAGFPIKMISVVYDSYSMGSSIKVKLLSFEIDSDAVKEVASQFESIRRCEATGDILGGGNQYVFVDYCWRMEYPAEILAIAEQAINERARYSVHSSSDVFHVSARCVELNDTRFKITQAMFSAVLCRKFNFVKEESA